MPCHVPGCVVLAGPMIEQVDTWLRDWGTRVSAGRPVVFDPPADRTGGTISLFLHRITDGPASRGMQRTPFQIMLHYVVTVSADTTEDQHRALGDLLVAAAAESRISVDLDPVGPEFWLALGVRPRPCFAVILPAIHEWPPVEIPLVRRPLEIRGATLSTLTGRLVGPNGEPIAGAYIEPPGLFRSTHTDHEGFFSFAGVAAELMPRHLRIRARGKDRTIEVDWSAAHEGPLAIPFDIND